MIRKVGEAGSTTAATAQTQPSINSQHVQPLLQKPGLRALDELNTCMNCAGSARAAAESTKAAWGVAPAGTDTGPSSEATAASAAPNARRPATSLGTLCTRALRASKMLRRATTAACGRLSTSSLSPPASQNRTEKMCDPFAARATSCTSWTHSSSVGARSSLATRSDIAVPSAEALCDGEFSVSAIRVCSSAAAPSTSGTRQHVSSCVRRLDDVEFTRSAVRSIERTRSACIRLIHCDMMWHHRVHPCCCNALAHLLDVAGHLQVGKLLSLKRSVPPPPKQTPHQTSDCRSGCWCLPFLSSEPC